MTTTIGDPVPPAALEVGDAPPPLVVGPISRTQIVRYAGAGGDFNPIHHDEPFATGAGQPSVFAHGLFTAGILSRLVSKWLGLPHVRRFGVRFTGQVWPGDTLTCSGSVTAVDAGAATCAFEVHRQTGELVLTGTAVARVA